MTRSFNLEKLLIDVFDPQKGETVTVMTDIPRNFILMTQGQTDRFQMALEWRSAFEKLGGKIGLAVNPMLIYKMTDGHNAPLPEYGEMKGLKVHIEGLLKSTNIFVALTEYSATAPLANLTRRYPGLRGATMPGVSKAMEETALSADYNVVAERCYILAERLTRSIGAKIEFSTDHQLYIDLRYRPGHSDDGRCRPGKKSPAVINLPSGEGYIVPYEGEKQNDPSRTHGILPAYFDNEIVQLKIEQNKIVEAMDDSPKAKRIRDYFMTDKGRQNIAELGFGCNDKAIVRGSVLEDEKVGLHIAYGRSDHLGGTIGPQSFDDPHNIEHVDIVYAKGCPITVTSLVLEYEDGSEEEILREEGYTIF